MELEGNIKRLNNLSLSYKAHIGREAKATDLKICIWTKLDDGNEYKYTIASLNYDEEYDYYTLNSCLDRLDDENINWNDFGELVKEGYHILNEGKMKKSSVVMPVFEEYTPINHVTTLFANDNKSKENDND